MKEREDIVKDVLPHEKAKQRAFRLLAMRARSEKELRSKLTEKGFDESIVADVVSRLRELNYLNDESFARQWAHNLGVNKLFGNRKIEASLREKGISRQIIMQVLSEVREELTEQKAILLLIRRKMDKGAGKLDDREKRRLAQSLMGKGFPPGLIFDILNRSKEGLLDEGE